MGIWGIMHETIPRQVFCEMGIWGIMHEIPRQLFCEMGIWGIMHETIPRQVFCEMGIWGIMHETIPRQLFCEMGIWGIMHETIPRQVIIKVTVEKKFVISSKTNIPLLTTFPQYFILQARHHSVRAYHVRLLFIGCLMSQQHASVSQGRVCSDNFTCCHTETEVADQTFYFTQSQYTDARPTRPNADPTTPGAWQGSHWCANFKVTGMTRPGKIPMPQAGIKPWIFHSRGGHLSH